MKDGDQLLLCTDGLTDMVSEPVIGKAFERTGGASDLCSTLVDLALEQGGRDNITVILGRYRIPHEA